MYIKYLQDCWPHSVYQTRICSRYSETNRAHILDPWYNFVFSVSDTRSDDWFLMNSVWVPVSIIAVYLYFVLNLGPRLMKNRPPMQLDTVIKTYNITQVIVCTYITEEVSISIDEFLRVKYWNEQGIFSYETEMFVPEFHIIALRDGWLNHLNHPIIQF
jgi:hypothetical protein